MRIPRLVRLVTLLAAAALAAPLAGAPARAAQPVRGHEALPPQVLIHATTSTIEPTAEPRLVTVGCNADEHLVSGGYTIDGGLRVVFSYPSSADGVPTTDGAEPAAWTIGVINPTRSAARVRLSVLCLIGDVRTTVSSTVKLDDQGSMSVSTGCPGDAHATAGGYASSWNPSSGIAAVSATYPVSADAWGIDITLIGAPLSRLPSTTVTAFAVCASGGVAPADTAPTSLTLTPGTPICSGFSAGAATCSTPWAGLTRVGCDDGELLVGAGYRATDGALPGLYSVVANEPNGAAEWIVRVAGTSPVPTPPSVDVTPVCLSALATKGAVGPSPSTQAGGVPRQLPTDVAIVAVVVLLALLALLALLVASQLRKQRGRRAPSARLQAVVRGQRSAYRIDGDGA
jgi:hypothetical protein